MNKDCVTYHHALNDAQSEALREFIPARQGPKPEKFDDHMVIDIVLYRVNIGVPRRDMRERFASWKTVKERVSNWTRRTHLARSAGALKL